MQSKPSIEANNTHHKQICPILMPGLSILRLSKSQCSHYGILKDVRELSPSTLFLGFHLSYKYFKCYSRSIDLNVLMLKQIHAPVLKRECITDQVYKTLLTQTIVVPNIIIIRNRSIIIYIYIQQYWYGIIVIPTHLGSQDLY